MKEKKKIKLPKLKNNLSKIIRVNYAGEYGAKRIYEGQLSVLENSKYGSDIKHMAIQEEEHLKYFESEMLTRRVRPSLLQPFWHKAGYALGKITALCGVNMAMICTEAVEEVIDKHYLKQIKTLDETEALLRDKIAKFREDELEHKEIAGNFNKNSTIINIAAGALIKFFCKLSINLAKKI
jgi:ubiquinone biosynthesis monooxygenase Coq7